MKKSKVVIILFILSFMALSSNKVFAYGDFNAYITNNILISDNADQSIYWTTPGDNESFCSTNIYLTCFYSIRNYPTLLSNTSTSTRTLPVLNILNNPWSLGDTAWIQYTSAGGNSLSQQITWDGTKWIDNLPNDLSTSTRIVSITSPLDNSTTTTSVTFSGSYYLSSDDASTTPKSYDFKPKLVVYVSNPDAPLNSTTSKSFSFIATSTDSIISFSTTTTLLNDTRYVWIATVRGNNNEPLSGTMLGKNFYQFTTGNFDPTFGENFDISTCNPFSGFDIGDCLYNLIVPKNGPYELAFNEAKEEFGTRVPWGYVTRVINILIATTTATSMPTIDYSFASSSPMSAIGNIHFEPFTLIEQSGTLINEFKSDRADSKTVWEIFMPFINMFVYVVLLFMIIHDLTGIHSGKPENDKQKE